MSNFQFANPSWGQLIWLVLILVTLLLWLDQRGTLALNHFLSITMQDRLAFRKARRHRWTTIFCLGLSAVCLVIAMMRPQWGLTFHRMPRVGTQIMVCLDVSRSMLAEDTAPNRLQRAKAEILDMLTFLEGDQVGLIAFAGKASVLCPLTPDFGFFRLILDDAGPHSVGLGGTVLAAPLRKALDGFRGANEASRVIMLITDGEDHAQHAEDMKQVAKLALEQGVQVIAIGFGNEQGSKIQFTDPTTGGRSTLRDNDGNEVITRLDGETLRELALSTEGVYIPAGTGLLDLQSIYDTHIASLVRGKLDDHGRAVRRDIFQWAILIGLLLLLLSIALAHAPATSIPFSFSLRVSVVAIALGISSISGLSMATAAAANVPTGDPASGSVDEETLPQNTPAATPTAPDDLQIPEHPRQAYNAALARLDHDQNVANQLLTAARLQAGGDGEVRYRATYNLGWSEIHRADRFLADKPQESLQHLHTAADWFREAIRLRPKSDVARHNLEIVLRRALQLADSLKQQETADISQRLDELIQAQRELLDAMRTLVETTSAKKDPHIVETMKSEFRRLAIQQRQILSDSEAIADQSHTERNAIMSKKDDDRSDEERVRAIQLESLQHHFFQAVQRMGQTRSQLRRKQSLRAYRRATGALSGLKQARDQLRDPVERLSTIITDADWLTRQTKTYGMQQQGHIGSRNDKPFPVWLDQEYLEQGQTSTSERTKELDTLWNSILAQSPAPTQGPAVPGTPDEPSTPPEAQQLLKQLRSAKPQVSQAVEQFQQAGNALKNDLALEAFDHQVKALASLISARELFLDLKQLIELAYADERRIQAILVPSDKTDVPDLQTLRELFPMTTDFQNKNLDRGERIGQLIRDSISSLPDIQGPATAQQAEQQKAEEASRQQLQTAQILLEQALTNMQHVADLLGNTPQDSNRKVSGTESGDSKILTPTAEESKTLIPSPETTPNESPGNTDPEESTDAPAITVTVPTADDVAQTNNEPSVKDEFIENLTSSVNAAVADLQALRRLFFSIIQHLRETAARQSELNDATETARTPTDKPLDQIVGPLTEQQTELAQLAKGIADALRSQSEQVTDSTGGQATNQPLAPQQDTHAAQVSPQFGPASKLVAKAAESMQSAVTKMGEKPADLSSTRNYQDQALEKLAAAITLLEPPQQNEQQQNEQQQNEQNGDQQEPTQEPQQIDPRRLLQAVRDREAQRRRKKSKQNQVQRGLVEKDW